MGFVDYAILAVILAVVGGAIIYIYRAKKKGKKCIGCPDSGCCSHDTCSGGCSCNFGSK